MPKVEKSPEKVGIIGGSMISLELKSLLLLFQRYANILRDWQR